MSIDFMNCKYILKIECDQPQRDDFQIENLISNTNNSDQFRR
jgi:hypothetical protein